MNQIIGVLCIRPLLVKPMEILKGELLLLNQALYEVVKVDKYNEYIHITYHANKYKRITEKMNLNSVMQKGEYLVLQTLHNFYEIRVDPSFFKNTLYCLYKRLPVKAELIKVRNDPSNATIAQLIFVFDSNADKNNVISL